MVTKDMSEAATEISIILENMSDDLQSKIPKKFVEFMRDISSATYEFKYDKTKFLNNQELKPLTRGVLALIYRDYICNQEEKQAYIKECAEILKELEIEKREKYNPDNIFKNNKEIITENVVEDNNTETSLVEVKEIGWHKKIFIKLKDIVSSIINNFKK